MVTSSAAPGVAAPTGDSVRAEFATPKRYTADDLDTIEAQMKHAPKDLQRSLNDTLQAIGVEHEELRARAGHRRAARGAQKLPGSS